LKAIVQDRYGSADVLELRDIDKPEIADDEVLVRVHAAGVDRGVWHVMTGMPYPIRLAGLRAEAPKKPVAGSDVAGVVEAVGKDVTRFQPGDEVFGIGKGAFAEYVRAPENKLAPKPANLTFEQAAGRHFRLAGPAPPREGATGAERADRRCVWAAFGPTLYRLPRHSART
jgi:NADPH:quinone reductase-like Zn-dependent oxidoreductase